MEYTKLGNSDLTVSRICMGCMGFGDPERGQHSWTIDEEPYVPHPLAGVMAQNKRSDAEKKHVWSVGDQLIGGDRK